MDRLKQIKIGLLVFLIGLLQMSSVLAAAQVTAAEVPVAIRPGDVLPNVTARSAVVMEAATGKILYSRDMDERRYPASTTKIMTLIVALENGNLDDIVTVSDNAAKTEGSTLWLEPGEQIKLSDLLYGMMLISGNDATVAVAEHIAGVVGSPFQVAERGVQLGGAGTQYAGGVRDGGRQGVDLRFHRGREIRLDIGDTVLRLIGQILDLRMLILRVLITLANIGRRRIQRLPQPVLPCD